MQMKILLVLLAAVSVSVSAQDENIKLEELILKDGKKYEDVTIRKVEPDGIRIMHKGGMARIPYEKLPKETCDRVGLKKDAVEKYHREQSDKTRKIAEKSKIERLKRDMLRPTSHRFKITPKIDNGVRVTYVDFIEMLKNTKEKSEAEEGRVEDLEADISRLPSGGYLIIRVERSTIGGADTANFLVIVKDVSGVEVARCRGERDTANVPSRNRLWWNNMIVYIPKRQDAGCDVKVVDSVGNEVSEFKIRPRR